MFPKNLPSAILNESVASILDIAQGIEREEEEDDAQTDNGSKPSSINQTVIYNFLFL